MRSFRRKVGPENPLRIARSYRRDVQERGSRRSQKIYDLVTSEPGLGAHFRVAEKVSAANSICCGQGKAKARPIMLRPPLTRAGLAILSDERWQRFH